MSTPVVINVVSGKGGTGKTLLTAVLAELLGQRGLKILIIDLDFFVRGLSTLLYFHKQEAINLVEKSEITIADLFIKKRSKVATPKLLGISNYRSFDVLPAVSRIDEKLNYDDIMPNSAKVAKGILIKLLRNIPKQYDVIFFDSRAGYDELISAIHSMSSASLCVEEEDQISRITADNLISQLRMDSNVPIFRIINKSRHQRRSRHDDEEARRSLDDIGSIPFDMDVLRSFGETDFWYRITKTMFSSFLVKAWNRFNIKLGMNFKLVDSRLNPLPSTAIEMMLSIFKRSDRIIVVYALFFSVAGFYLTSIGKYFFQGLAEHPIQLVGFISLAVGIIATMLTVFRSQE